jgi:protoheme IX farnesyltransferase
MKPQAATYEKAHGSAASGWKAADLLQLSKARLNSLVVLTTAGGYYMARPDAVDIPGLALTCIGTALVAAGAAAVNQVQERDVDALMARTRHRPVAEGRMRPTTGIALAAGMTAVGLGLLGAGSNAVATTVALATLLIYVLVYTPLKRRTSLATVVGAIPGALPPLIGWAAVKGSIAGLEPLTLFALMFFWQLPHFLAIAWMAREDYARAGLPMLSVLDPDGSLTGRQAALWAGTLIPVSLSPFLAGMTGPLYAFGALAVGLAQLLLAARFAAHRSVANARRLFYGSIAYLPVLWALMILARR